MSQRSAVGALFAGALVLLAAQASAADTWLQVKSANFTVMTNAGERKARNVAAQFEQVRAAIRKGWPWAHVALDRPVFVIAVKDESSMRALAPQYWERRGQIHPASIFLSAADRHYIALRADVEVEDQGMNPYNAAFRAYCNLILEASFDRGLPLWLTNGLAAVLSNTIILDKEVQFGKPIKSLAELARTGPRLSLAALVAVTRESPEYRQEDARERFDAQSWALVQFMMYGAKTGRGELLNRVSRLLMDGVPSDKALREVYGSLDTLKDAADLYVQQGVYNYERLLVESDTSSAKLPARTLGSGESAAERAGFHAAMGRLAEARALVTEARTSDPTLVRTDEVEALMLDREQKTADARQAYAKAAAAGSTNFWVFYRLAVLSWGSGLDATALAPLHTQLERATALNQDFPQAYAILASVRLQLKQAESALVVARRAVELDPGNVRYRLLYAQVLARLSRQAEAAAVAKDALSYVKEDQERTAVQTFLTSLVR